MFRLLYFRYVLVFVGYEKDGFFLCCRGLDFEMVI